MNDPRPVARSPDWSRLCHLIEGCLPVRDLRSLLTRLVSAWQEICDLQSVLLAVRPPAAASSEERLFGCFLSENDTVHCAETIWPSSKDWSEEAALQTLQSPVLHLQPHDQGTAAASVLLAETLSDWSPSSAISLPTSNLTGDSGPPALLFLSQKPDSPGIDVSQEIVRSWIRISGRLIDQACAQEQEIADRNEQLLHAKLESLAEFAAGAGHEINNPVATISGRVQLLLKEETDPERRQSLAVIGGQAHRIRDMIGDAMLFGRPPQPNPQKENLTTTVQAVLESQAEAIRSSGVQVLCDASPVVPVWADRVQLNIVVSELLRNSLEAIGEKGVIQIDCQSLSHTTPENREFAQLTIQDSGRGLSAEDRAHLFDPFYSGRQAGRGLGFGLPKCWKIVSNHGGKLRVESAPNGDTRFVVLWPVPPKESERE